MELRAGTDVASRMMLGADMGYANTDDGCLTSVGVTHSRKRYAELRFSWHSEVLFLVVVVVDLCSTGNRG